MYVYKTKDQKESNNNVDYFESVKLTEYRPPDEGIGTHMHIFHIPFIFHIPCIYRIPNIYLHPQEQYPGNPYLS